MLMVRIELLKWFLVVWIELLKMVLIKQDHCRNQLEQDTNNIITLIADGIAGI